MRRLTRIHLLSYGPTLHPANPHAIIQAVTGGTSMSATTRPSLAEQLTSLRHRFTYHRPDTARAAAHQAVRDACLRLATTFFDQLPEGREKALAHTKIEEAMFWANAAIARDVDPDAA